MYRRLALEAFTHSSPSVYLCKARGLIVLLVVTLLMATTVSGCSNQAHQEDEVQPPQSSANKAHDASDIDVTPPNEQALDEQAPDETISDAKAPDVEVSDEPVIDQSVTENLTEQVSPQEQSLSASTGQSVYEQKCKVCHEPGLLNSPKLGDTAMWTPRIAKGKETLYEHSAEGFNQMPPQAVNGVSEAQVRAAVDYMIEKSS